MNHERHEAQNENYYAKTNTIFLWMLWGHLPLMWLTASLCGTSLVIATLVSLALLSIPTLLTFTQKESTLTSVVHAMATVGFSALLIYLSKGMTEMHFHVFASIGILIMLAQPTAILAALGVVVVHHVGFFFLFPKALINYDAGFGILVIHALFALAIGIPAFFISAKFKMYIVSVKDLVSEMVDIADSLVGSSTEVRKTASSLAQSTSDESAAMERTTSALAQLRAMIASNSTNAENSANSANDSKLFSSEGMDVVNKVVQALEEIKQNNDDFSATAQQTTDKMAEIAASIKMIGEKTKIINDIVFQTKLLSFNASVEAARAGEHGKGFSVVAEEVGNLAQLSGNSAKEITELLDSSIQNVEMIVSQTQNSVNRIVDTARSKISNGVEIANECRSILEKIDHNLTSVNEMTQEISKASKEQTIGVDEITDAMNKVENASKVNKKVSSETNEVSENLDNESNRLNQAIQNLAMALDGRKAA